MGGILRHAGRGQGRRQRSRDPRLGYVLIKLVAAVRRDMLAPAKPSVRVFLMQRREALAILMGATVALPLAVRAQQMPVVGYLNPTSPDMGAPFAAAFRRGLSDAGYVEGQNLAIE